MTYILGLNAYHGDSSACLVKDGQLIAAAEEERFRRIKHWAGLPSKAVDYCLMEGRVNIGDIDYIAVNRNPKAHVLRKALFVLQNHPSLEIVRDRLQNAFKMRDIKTIVGQALKVDRKAIRAKVYHVEHHLAHLASAFMVSPFKEAAVVSVDGFGDFVGAMWGTGSGNRLEPVDRIFFPHSLGLFYLALTQYLGFPKYGDEYKVMGLAALGTPTKMDQMRKLVKLYPNGKMELELEYFIHHSKGAAMTWEGGEPKMGAVYSDAMEALLGPARKPQEKISKRHQDIAASLQRRYEEAFFYLLNHVYRQTQFSNLCLAGGCAMNSVANGKIFDQTAFKQIYIQAAAGDAGGALGAAYYVWNQVLNNKRNFAMESSYWGPEFSETEIKNQLEAYRDRLSDQNCSLEHISNKDELCQKAAQEIANGKVLGWFQGRMEWGPRALGNRSIVVDPRRAEMQDVLNARIKRRETFRPFAPSILLEKVGDYFEKDYPDPFMIKVYPVKVSKRAVIPAVTHVDGTGRLQTVSKEDNSLYWQLIKNFENLTGVPVLLNTSFNENEPIVCTPKEALDCFLRTKMDTLVMNNWFMERKQP